MIFIKEIETRYNMLVCDASNEHFPTYKSYWIIIFPLKIGYTYRIYLNKKSHDNLLKSGSCTQADYDNACELLLSCLT